GHGLMLSPLRAGGGTWTAYDGVFLATQGSSPVREPKSPIIIYCLLDSKDDIVSSRHQRRPLLQAATGK
ncbi:MAG: hypothetical protein L0J11_12695, partial [Micrococcaceae bacterium]|nr:hypothetical protein [Micrococcaceae bacterium]